jgi:hypothetical protein
MKTLAADRALSGERALNTAIVNADITRGFEEYLVLVDQYYAEDVEVSADTSPDPVVGRDQSKVYSFPLPRTTSHDRRDRRAVGVDPRSLNTRRFP